jgi:hypothetical protein
VEIVNFQSAGVQRSRAWPGPCSPRRTLRHSIRGRTTAIARFKGKLTAIRELLDRDVVCLEIVRYLLDHNEAADTARGIAEWWIGRDVAKTAEALSRLQAFGVVRSYHVQDATSVYTFTRNAILRDNLRQHFGGAPAPAFFREQ